MIGDILQPTHLLFILVVALLVLGPKRLPEAGRALGKGIRDFRMAIGGEEAHPGDIATQSAAQVTPEPVQVTPEPVQVTPEPAQVTTEPAHQTEQAETVHPVG